MITNLFASLALPMAGWCANPNGCTSKVTTPVIPAENVTDIGTIDRAKDAGEDFTQKTIDNTMDSMVSTAVWEIAKIGILIVLAIIAFVVIKKLMKSGAEKARAFAAKMNTEETLRAFREQKERYAGYQSNDAKIIVGDKFLDEDEVRETFHGALEDGRSFYEDELAKQKDINQGFENSLSSEDFDAKPVSMEADGLTIASLNDTIRDGIEMLKIKPLNELYADYSNDLSMKSLLPTDLNAINAVIEDMDMPSQESISKALKDIEAQRQQMRSSRN